ncbi:LLM class flavin-dependent oxidoreductase [Gulosibacter faecalis]|uniref:LLM class flavin-dependent oxidoreductase n=1 Tax=Gulosibacter faecalis TaxID=272240 RepID=A0ABW5V106_9MICO|nr:LLM class flavin-dependent oxidoreductase [Gulosibacter faecalis]
MTNEPSGFSIGLGIRGAGWHAGADARGSFATGDPESWARIAREADDAGIDVLTVEDSLAPGTASATFDSFALTNWLAPQTARIGLVPTATVNQLEPFHTATAVATLDFTSQGRAGVRPRVGTSPTELRAVGREGGIERVRDVRELPLAEFEAQFRGFFGEATEFIEVVRLLWDSWEDNAEIRDLATSRFIDRERLHNPEFVGDHFSVYGASITPRPPQGQPPVITLAHTHLPYRFAAATSDVALITPGTEGTTAEIVASLAAASEQVDRRGSALKVWADVNVLIGDAETRLRDLDAAGGALTSDAALVAGDAESVARRLLDFRSAGLDGIRVRPLDTDVDTRAFLGEVLPLLRADGVTEADGADLRTRLGLAPAPNRYVAQAPFTADTAAVLTTTEEVSA